MHIPPPPAPYLKVSRALNQTVSSLGLQAENCWERNSAPDLLSPIDLPFLQTQTLSPRKHSMTRVWLPRHSADLALAARAGLRHMRWLCAAWEQLHTAGNIFNRLQRHHSLTRSLAHWLTHSLTAGVEWGTCSIHKHTDIQMHTCAMTHNYCKEKPCGRIM